VHFVTQSNHWTGGSVRSAIFKSPLRGAMVFRPPMRRSADVWRVADMEYGHYNINPTAEHAGHTAYIAPSTSRTRKAPRVRGISLRLRRLPRRHKKSAL